MTAVMEPPVRSIALPKEVADLIVEMAVQERTGSITIHFVGGNIRSLDRKDMRRIGAKD